MWLAASDAVLALAALNALMRLHRAALQRSVRWAARAGIALVGLAAAAGALRFGGLASLAELHRFLSDQSAIVAIPILAIAVFAHHNAPAGAGRSWTKSALYVLCGLLAIGIVMQQRSVAALSSIAALTALIVSRPRQSTRAALLLAGLVAAGGLRAWAALPLESRLIGLHLVLAIWLVVYVRCLDSTPAAGQAIRLSVA